MKKVSFIFLSFISLTVIAQKNYFQQNLSYTIDVKLDDNSKSLNAIETIIYKNNSSDTLKFIWFHIWPNAYKNKSTLFFSK